MFILVIFLKKIIEFIIRKSLNPTKKKKIVLQVLIFLPSIIYFLSSKK
jgi:hypothetical protein